MLPQIFLLSLFLAFLPLNSAQLSLVGDGHVLEPEAESPRIYIVHVRKPEHMLSASPQEVEEWHKSFLPSPTIDSGEPRMVISYKVVMSGFAARLTAKEVRAMEAKEGFVYARPDEKVIPQTTYSPDFLGLRPDVWRDANRGEGAIIAVIDTGISPRHDSFQGNEMPNPPDGWNGWCYFDNRATCNDKLLGAAEFSEEDHRVQPPNDDDGHGTHVAATIAGLEVAGASIRGYAAGTAAGAAPGAYLAAYRADTHWQVLWSIEQAIHDGAHVISMSIGNPPPVGRAPPPFYSSAIAVGALAAVRQGIVVSCAAGNSGPRPSTVCNDAPWIMTVGASTMDRVLRVNLRLGNGDEIPGESLYSEEPGLRAGLVYPGVNGDWDADVCSNLNGFDVNGKVVMCYQGDIEPKDKAKVVLQAGGVAMVVMSVDVVGSIIVDVPDLAIPTVAVNSANSLRLIEYVNTTRRPCPPRVEFVPVGTVTGEASSPAVPYFSSRGPSLINGGILKPDILGPGVNVLAANVSTTSGFVLKSGTSMATPHLSGIAAIVKLFQLRETGDEWTPAMVRSAIMTTADTTNREGGDITDETDGPAGLFATGAGHVNPPRAMDPGLVFDLQFEDYVKYLCGLGYTDSEVLRTAAMDVKCDEFGKIEPEQLNYPSISTTISDAVRRKVISRTVTSVRSQPTSYTAELSFPTDENGIKVSVSPNTLSFEAMGETKSFDVIFSLAASSSIQPGDAVQGNLKWISTTQSPVVSSPLLVTIA